MGKGGRKGGRKGGSKGRWYIVAMLLMLATPVIACETPECVCEVPDAAFIDNDTQRLDWGYGVGLDTVVYRSDKPYLQQVKVETRYDIENRETRVFAVAQVDLFSLLGGK